MLERQTLDDATERMELLERLDARGLLDTEGLQQLLKEQKRVYWALKRKDMENQLRTLA